MRTRPLVLVLLLVALTAGLGACTGSGSSGSSGRPAAGGASGSRAAGGAGGDVAAGPGGAQPAPGQAGRAAPVASTALIRTAELTVAVRGAARVAGQADRAEDIAVSAGGEVDGDDRTGGAHAAATLQLRVPPDQLRPVLTALGRLGRERDRTTSTTDVSERVADVGARLTSARAALARLRALYADATKVSDVLAVEAQLSDREADLESLEAQQRTLSRQTQLARITLSLYTASTTPAKHTDRYAGVLGGLRRGWDAFLTAGRAVGTAAGAALPFLALAALVLVVAARSRAGRVGRRIRRPGSLRRSP